LALSGTQLRETKTTKEVFSSTRFTEAEKLSVSHYIPRDDTHFINFMVDSGNDFEKNSTWAVKAINQNSLRIQNIKTLEEKDFNPKEFLASSFDVVEKKSLEIREGETLLIQKNERLEVITKDKDSEKELSSKNKLSPAPPKEFTKFTNGELVQVKEIRGSSLVLSDERVIDDRLKNIDYGYVTTSYSAQGKTCDHVIVAMTNAGGKALSQEQFYVSTSRGRSSIDIFVEDKEFIQSRIEAMGNRPFNLELMEKDQKEQIKSLQFSSIEQLKEKSLELAKNLATEIQGEKLLSAVIIEPSNSKAPHWKDRLQTFREKELAPLIEQMKSRIQVSLKRIQKEEFPLEKEASKSSLTEKITNWNKEKSMDKDFDR